LYWVHLDGSTAMGEQAAHIDDCMDRGCENAMHETQSCAMKFQTSLWVAVNELSCAHALEARYHLRGWGSVTSDWLIPNELHVSQNCSSLLLMPLARPCLTLLELARLTPEDRMEEEAVLFYLNQILRILNRTHSVGIAHGDIRPENFLLVLGSKAPQQVVHGCNECSSTNSGSSYSSVKLVGIDLGCARDILGSEVQVLQHSSNFCVEYQQDLQGVAAIAYMLLFGERLSLPTDVSSVPLLRIHQRLRSLQRAPLWMKLFSKLLAWDVLSSDLIDGSSPARSRFTASPTNTSTDLHAITEASMVEVSARSLATVLRNHARLLRHHG